MQQWHQVHLHLVVTLSPRDAGTSHKPDPDANRGSFGAIDGTGEDR
jgi:hypothetical protein